MWFSEQVRNFEKLGRNNLSIKRTMWCWTWKRSWRDFASLGRSYNQVTISFLFHPIKEFINCFINSLWLYQFHIYCRITSLEDELAKSSDSSKSGKFVEIKTNLVNWIHNVEGVLLSEHPVINSISIMEAQLKRFKVNLFAIWKGLICLYFSLFCMYMCE